MNAWNRYWHDFALHPLRIAALRVAFFGLLAVDLWHGFVEHAPRYGAGDMNATQFAWLDTLLPVPSAAVVGAAWLIGGFLAARAALGIAVRQSAVLLAMLYGGVYVWCQADSYQHHYLICLLLLVFAFIPDPAWHGRWTQKSASKQEGDAATDARHWALRMIYVQLALVYFWTGFTKVDPVWLSGDTLHQLTASAENQALINSLADALGVSHAHIHVWASWAVMIGELGATAFFLWRRLWWVGLLIVPWFHVGVEIIGFDIELFSYYMIMIDIILLAPRRVYTTAEALGAGLAARLAALRDRLGAIPAARGARVAVAAIAAAAAAALAAALPYEGTTTVAIAVAVLTLQAGLARVGALIPVAAAHVAIAGLMLASAAFSEVPYDYYRLWGGDLKKRGEIDLAIEMYRRANAMNEGPARLQQLGDLLARKGEHEAARAAYAEAVERNERALQAEKTASFKDPTNPERHYDLAERYLTLVARTDALAGAWRRAGEGAKAAELAKARGQHLADARGALAEARRLDPRSPRVGRLLRELQRLDRR